MWQNPLVFVNLANPFSHAAQVGVHRDPHHIHGIFRDPKAPPTICWVNKMLITRKSFGHSQAIAGFLL